MPGTTLIIIAVLLLKPFWSDVQSHFLPLFTLYDGYDKLLSKPDHIVMTLQLPRQSEETPGVKRQFDPWGGKKRSNPSVDEKMLKRQFSPWGGKRSSELEVAGEQAVDHQSRLQKDSFKKRSLKSFYSKTIKSMPGNINFSDAKRDLNLWSGKSRKLTKRDIASRNSFNSWGGKRSFQPWGGKRSFISWGRKRSFQPWGGKRSFQPWGGKRSGNFQSNNISFDPGLETWILNTLSNKKYWNSLGEKRNFDPLTFKLQYPQEFRK